VSCTPRIHPFPAAAIRIAGTARLAIRTQGSAVSAMRPWSAPPANTDTRGTAVSCTATTMVVPIPSASQVACTPSSTAAVRSPAP